MGLATLTSASPIFLVMSVGLGLGAGVLVMAAEEGGGVVGDWSPVAGEAFAGEVETGGRGVEDETESGAEASGLESEYGSKVRRMKTAPLMREARIKAPGRPLFFGKPSISLGARPRKRSKYKLMSAGGCWRAAEGKGVPLFVMIVTCKGINGHSGIIIQAGQNYPT